MCSAPSKKPLIRRDIEIVPTVAEGEHVFVIRDFLGLITKPLLVEQDTLAVLGLFDGRRTIEDVQVEFVRMRRGAFVSTDDIRNLVDVLDAALVLDSPRFRRARERLIEDYSCLDVRESSLAGRAFPAEAEVLRESLEEILREGGEEKPSADPDKIVALVAPHIELETGKTIYGRAYSSIREVAPDLVILLGTGHSLEDGYFSLTEKDFETPLGRVPTDRDIVNILKDSAGEAVASRDIAHKREHSLEFQLIFLQYLYGAAFSLIPVLCGSFARELGRASRPSDIPDVAGFCRALGEILKSERRRTLVVAGVDLSHIGPKFGHREDATSLLREARRHDDTLVEAACRGDVEGFWRESARVRDKYNVCGFSSLAVLLEILGPVNGTLLGYEFWPEEATRSAVSYAAVLFEKSD